jgi:predicted dehydrogenase
MIKAGLFGCGHLGKMHLKNLMEIQNIKPEVNIVGINDIDKYKLNSVSKEFNIKPFEKMDGLIQEINAAIIVTTTSSHFEIANKTIENNIHTFIEKPITESILSANKLFDLSLKKKVKIQIGHIERYNPAMLALEDFELNPMFIESHRLSMFNPRGADVSVIQDIMIHDLDIILNIVNSKIKSIDANGVALITDKLDIANARIKFENGCVANVTASRISQKKMRKMRIFQKNAYISIDFLKNITDIFRLKDLTNEQIQNISPDIFEYNNRKFKVFMEQKSLPGINPMRMELVKFFDCILNDTEPEIDIEDGIKAIETADEIIKNIKEVRS